METFLALLALCAEIHRSPLNSPHKVQWRGALMFSLICVWMNGWVNNLEAGDLRRHCAHCDVIVMSYRLQGSHHLGPWPNDVTRWQLGDLEEIEGCIFKLILAIDGRGIYCEIALRWMLLDLTAAKSKLVRVMTSCRQAISYYLSQCWPSSMSPYGVVRPQ